MVLKGGQQRPFLVQVFERKEEINSYEYVPKDVTNVVDTPPALKPG
jgi:hypothetical protein